MSFSTSFLLCCLVTLIQKCLRAYKSATLWIIIFVFHFVVDQPGQNSTCDSEGTGEASPWAHELAGLHSDAGHLPGTRSGTKMTQHSGGIENEHRTLVDVSFSVFLLLELLIPNKANVFYAMSTTANFDFVLRQSPNGQKKPLTATSSLGLFTK